MQARASGSSSECLALRASLQCAALLLGPQSHAQYLTAFQEMLSEAAVKVFPRQRQKNHWAGRLFPSQSLSSGSACSPLDHTGFPSRVPSCLFPGEFLAILKAQTKEPSFEPSTLPTFSYLNFFIHL